MLVDFNIQILQSLINQKPQKANEASIKFPRLDDWQNRKAKPTFKQLLDLAKYFNVPFGYFFLDKLPQTIYPIPHYRTAGKIPFKASDNLLKTIRTVQEKQECARDILLDSGAERLPFAGTYNISSSITETAISLHQILNLEERSSDVDTWSDMFRVLVEQTEKIGIFVVVNGVIGHSNINLDVNEFRGFVLYDEIAPFIFVNGKDFVTGKIFTIIHEIVHILIGESASFDLENLMAPSDPVEHFCDAVTAEFLVPAIKIREKVNKIGANIQVLAREFKVSRIVIARRLLDLKIISDESFFAFYNSQKKVEIKPPGPGGNFYNTAPYRVSRRFFEIIYREVRLNKMLYRDAFRLTGLSPKSFDGYINKVIA